MNNPEAPWRDLDKLTEAVENTYTIQEASNLLNCSHQTIQTWFGNHGVTRVWRNGTWTLIPE